MKLFLAPGERVKLKGRIDSTVFDCMLSGTRLNEDHSEHYRELRTFWIEGERLQNAMAGKSRTEQEALYEQFQQVTDRRRACEMIISPPTRTIRSQDIACGRSPSTAYSPITDGWAMRPATRSSAR